MVTSATRTSLIASLAASIATLPGMARIAVDGVDAAGKSVFGDELTEAIRALQRPVIRASVDDFHHPRERRYRRGRLSPEGFFQDSYDYAALRACLLDPLGSRGSGVYRRAVFDHTTDQAVDAAPERALPGSVLVLDGIFLHRDELIRYWDYSVYLHVEFEETFARMARRDGSDPDPSALSNRRYFEGQRLYLASCQPQQRASVVVDNTDLSAPHIVRPAASRGIPRRPFGLFAGEIAVRDDLDELSDELRQAFEGGPA